MRDWMGLLIRGGKETLALADQRLEDTGRVYIR